MNENKENVGGQSARPVSSLTRRDFMKKVTKSLIQGGVLIGALAMGSKAKATYCVRCDDEQNTCYGDNDCGADVCGYDTCYYANHCNSDNCVVMNGCGTDRCEVDNCYNSDGCYTDVCGVNSCSMSDACYTNDPCETSDTSVYDMCYYDNMCDTSDTCSYSNYCNCDACEGAYHNCMTSNTCISRDDPNH